MRNSILRFLRSFATLAGAGVLLQAGGCGLTPTDLVGGLFTSIVNSTIANFVFGAFGLAI